MNRPNPLYFYLLYWHMNVVSSGCTYKTFFFFFLENWNQFLNVNFLWQKKKAKKLAKEKAQSEASIKSVKKSDWWYLHVHSVSIQILQIYHINFTVLVSEETISTVLVEKYNISGRSRRGCRMPEILYGETKESGSCWGGCTLAAYLGSAN